MENSTNAAKLAKSCVGEVLKIKQATTMAVLCRACGLCHVPCAAPPAAAHASPQSLSYCSRMTRGMGSPSLSDGGEPIGLSHDGHDDRHIILSSDDHFEQTCGPPDVPPSPSKTKGRHRAYFHHGDYSSSSSASCTAISSNLVCLGKNATPPLQHESSRPFSSFIYNCITSPLVNFWYNDSALPPLYGPLRFAFYATLLLILLTQPDGSGALCFKATSCNRALKRMEHYDNFGFDMKFEAGFMALVLDVFGWDAQVLFGNKTSWLNCKTMMYGVRYGLGLSALGLGGVVPRIVTATCWWIMFGIKMISWGPSPGHEQYLAGVGLVALCFANNNLIDVYSVDSLLYKAWAWMAGKSPTTELQKYAWDGISPSPGRAARKIVVFTGSSVMFFAGVHKFASYGLTWLDGGTILASLHPNNNARIEFLRAFVVKYSWFFVAPMATVSVIGELLSIFALLSPSWRHVIVASWVQFHVGIMILMHPNFAMQMATYMLMIDWGRLLGGTCLARLLPFLADTLEVPKNKGAISAQFIKCGEYPRSRRVGSIVYTLIAAAMYVMSLLRIDYWPFSSYALYNWHSSDPGFDGKPMTPKETISSASQCFAHPPIGSTCGNKNGSNHHDSIIHSRKSFIKKVFVTGVVADKDSPVPQGTCEPNELRVYVNLDPFMCWPRPTDGSQMTAKDIRRIMREVTMKKKRPKRPQELDWPEYVRRGLAWRVEDAMLASLEDHPRCFEPLGTANANERNWMAEPARDSIGSDMARRLRSGLTDHKYLPDYPREKVLGVGLFWTYLDGGSGERNEDGDVEGGTPRVCNVGESVLGDLDLVEGQEIGSRFRNHIESHGRDWTQVQRGIVLVCAILGGALAYSAKFHSNN